MPRVYELAKQLDKNSKEILDGCRELSIDAKTHSSGISDDEAARVLSYFSNASGGKVTQKREERMEIKKDIKTVNENMPDNKEASRNIEALPGEVKAAVPERRLTQEQEGTFMHDRPRSPRPESEDPNRPRRPRPEGEDHDRPRRPRPEGEDPNRPRRPRPEGEDPNRPRRPRPEGEDPNRPRRPRPEGEDPNRPRRPRPEGEDPNRPRRPRPEGEDPNRPRRPRPEGEDPNRPRRPRPEGADPNRPRRPRPEGEDPNRPRRPRPEGEDPNRPRRPRPEGEDPNRPRRPRPEGEDPNRPRRPRPEGEDPNRPRRPRAESEDTRPRAQKPESEESVSVIDKQSDRPDRQHRQDRPAAQRPDGGFARTHRPYTGEISELKPTVQRTDGRPEQRTGQRPSSGQRPPREGGFSKPPYQKDGFQKSGYQQRGGKPGGSPQRGGQQGGPVKLQQMSKPDTRTSRGDNFKKDRTDRGKQLGEDISKVIPKAGVRHTKPSKQSGKPIKQKQAPPKEEKIEITMAKIPENITVKHFAEAIGKNTSLIIKTLMKNGIMANLNQEIDFQTASKIGEQLNVIIDLEEEKDLLEEAFKEEPDNEKDLVERPPVVVVMGHVDHGKTSLLDAIRDSAVQVSEAGGITQHIGAYTTKINDRTITFLDTPGHEAFTAMRMRGASITDIAILVVAADDGVMPQTVEAINHAKAAGVEIVVAINKIDKPSANPDRVKQELTEHGILIEEWGGETVCVHVSAKKRTGLDKLLEMILLVADIKELKANPNKRAKGTVVEALLDKGRGPVATVLIQEGTLNVGDSIVAGSCYGKVRAMMDDKGKRVKKAGPSKPVEIIGLSEAPKAGDVLYAAENDRQARQITEMLIAKDRIDMTRASAQKVSLDDLFSQIKAGNVKDLNIVIKADVQGSVEAVRQSLERLSNDEVKIRTIHGGVGSVNESDVMLAAASNAIIIGFNVRPEQAAKSVAEAQDVDIRLYRVIYNAIEDINAAIKGMLEPVYAEKVIGHAEIRQVFKASGVGTIGGAYVQDGKFIRNGKVRIMRNSSVIYEGELESLKRFKDDVKEVAAGYECGLLFNKYNDIKEGDIVEAFVMEEVER